MYCELPPGSNWNFDVQWAPGQLAGVFATATYEGQIGVSSLSACTAVGAGDASDGFSIGQGEWALRRRGWGWAGARGGAARRSAAAT